jgi:hypothetical protein
MDTIPNDFNCYLLQVGLKKVMNVVLSEVVLEDAALKVWLIVW